MIIFVYVFYYYMFNKMNIDLISFNKFNDYYFVGLILLNYYIIDNLYLFNWNVIELF